MKISTELHDYLVKYYLDTDIQNIDEWEINSPTMSGEPLLHHLSVLESPQHVAVLVSHGADVNAPGDLGNTAICWAARFGFSETVALLLDLGADPCLRDEFGENIYDFLDLVCDEIRERLLKWRNSNDEDSIQPVG